MYYTDKLKHHLPHIHVKYNEYEAVFTIDEGNMLKGTLPKSKTKLVQAWIEIHKKELMINWQLAVNKERPHMVEPLK
jgi:hypothetical protein